MPFKQPVYEQIPLFEEQDKATAAIERLESVHFKISHHVKVYPTVEDLKDAVQGRTGHHKVKE